MHAEDATSMFVDCFVVVWSMAVWERERVKVLLGLFLGVRMVSHGL